MIIPVSAITKELVLACRQLGLVVSEPLAAFIAVTVVNPATGSFFVDKPLEEGEARAVVEAAVKKLFAKQLQPDLEVLKLQCTFETTAFDAEKAADKVEAQRRDAEKRILARIDRGDKPLKFEQQVFDEISETYRRIFQLLLLTCGHPDATGPPAGDPAEVKAIEREVAAALESVFPRVGLRAFMSLSSVEKAAQLSELSSIVFGIRLYNVHLAKGGVGLPVEVLNDSTTELVAELKHECDAEALACQELTHFVLFAPHMAEKPDDARLQQLTVALQYRRQMLAALLSTYEDVITVAERLTSTRELFEAEIQQLDVHVGARSSVPKEQVYPRFDALARAFKMAWQDSKVLAARKQAYGLLRGHRGSYSPVLDAAEAAVLAATREAVGEEAAGLADPAGGAAPEMANGCTYMSMYEDGFMEVGLDHEGYCLATLVDCPGAVVPGNPELGIVQWNGQSLCFATKARMASFVEKAQHYGEQLPKLCAQFPCLLALLRYEKLPNSSLSGILRGTAGVELSGAALQADVAVATPLHFVESHIDPTYEWNEWKMRSRALHLADIRRRTTAASQTALSALRRETTTQVYLPKEKATSTGVSQGTNPPRWKRYMAGLRGETKDGAPDFQVVDLQLEI